VGKSTVTTVHGGKIAGRRTKFIVGGAIIILVVGWLVYSSIQGSTTPYLTVGELIARGPSEHVVRVTGLVGAAIDWDSQHLVLHFEIVDGNWKLPVLYKGTRPDMLRDGAQAVVEGRYRADGVFEASSVLLKCPSKYVEE